MKKLKSGVIYHGGTLPIPSHLQKGTLKLEAGTLRLLARGKDPRFDVDLRIPLDRIENAAAEERKYYSSVGYFLLIDFRGEDGEANRVDLEIRSFIRRGRTQALCRHWADLLLEYCESRRPEKTS